MRTANTMAKRLGFEPHRESRRVASGLCWLSALSLVVGAALTGCTVPVPTDGTDESISDAFVLNVRRLTSEADADQLRTVAGDPIIHFKPMADVGVNTDALPDVSRHFLMGTVPIGAPAPGFTDDDLFRSITFAGQGAECFVMRQKIDWESFRPGGIAATAEFTAGILELVRAARSSGFTAVLIELDPIVDRHNVGPLPPAIAGQDFSSPDVREALRRQALIVAEEAKPEYLSLAVEANGYFQSNPGDFDNFVSLHKELYHEIKAVSPDTQVLISFNLEAIQGLLADSGGLSVHGPQWFLIDKFEPEVDAVAFSTLPFPVFFEAVQLPDDYLSRITEHTDRPIVLSEVGWSTSVETGHTEQQQAEYLSLMARQALNEPQIKVFAWTIYFDAADGSIFDAFPDFKFLGLLSADATPKLAFNVWADLFNRPLVYEAP